jgi:putative DNA primase/helicase
LNCSNGTLDLRSGKFCDHRREDLCTKIVRVDYDSTAACPLFDGFLNRIMSNNVELVSFVRRAIGYSLTGSIKEQCFFIAYGSGQNGKTTFFEPVRKLLGDYAKTADSSLLLIKNGNSIRNDVARLAGARFVSTSETEAGRILAEALVKQLTGGDTITSRFLYREFFEFTSQFKVFLVTNHRPQVRGVDNAIWRRIRLIPFDVTIPDEELDKDLGEKLLGELPGILAWAVRGCLEWQEKGLGMPPEVSAATEAYRQESDLLGAFIEDCCVQKPDNKIPVATLYYAYQQWCKHNAEELLEKNEFGLQLSERGFGAARDGRKRYRRGISLAT